MLFIPLRPSRCPASRIQWTPRRPSTKRAQTFNERKTNLSILFILSSPPLSWVSRFPRAYPPRKYLLFALAEEEIQSRKRRKVEEFNRRTTCHSIVRARGNSRSQGRGESRGRTTGDGGGRGAFSLKGSGGDEGEWNSWNRFHSAPENEGWNSQKYPNEKGERGRERNSDTKKDNKTTHWQWDKAGGSEREPRSTEPKRKNQTALPSLFPAYMHPPFMTNLILPLFRF